MTVPVVLARLARARAISTQTATLDLRRWRAALAEERHLPPVRRAQLTAVTVIVHDLAARGALTAGRLPEVFLMLERNMQWWWHGPLLSYGQRVAFAGSALEWEYYPGAGIQLQVLGTFGEANGFYEAGRADWPRLTALMNEMIPLAVPRGGGLAWEYLFPWEGGSPPWVSAMAQATALEALANAYRVSHDPIYLSTGEQALGILETPPPVGVAQTTALGTRFLQYSFAPQTDIINAFLQTLIGLDDFAQVSGDVTAQRLFRSGDAQAQAELPSFNTGAWSLYQPGESDDLSYHQLVTGFLQTLCGLTRTPLYCATAQDFSADLTTPPTIVQRTLSVRARHLAHLVFRLDKPARVGVIVTAPRGRDVLYTSADCQPGTDYWILPKLARGTYAVTLSATDLAGNYRTVSGTLRVR
ncbi:MAG TPA: D-glucuronyl C5-epimerase family protein [Solirubrobacteraceae bacterium]|nr:D-glucuronyl C5-epimerase family protein [Solirubrobacteraceae bacterium]